MTRIGDDVKGAPRATAFDLAIIGGGINGCGIARDAAGRGWRPLLLERADFGAGTSGASTKLIHGGLRYLEHREFRLVREALQEREVLWGIAPHVVWPLRFVLPVDRGMRPAWLLRLGLFLYDHLGGRRRLPPTRSVRLAGGPLQDRFTRGFEYSDCWVEDSRLTVLNARDAAERGAAVRPRTECVAAAREGDLWRLELRDVDTGAIETAWARALVNAAGPWVGAVSAHVVRANGAARIRLVQGSHIVVPRLFEGDGCFIFQNADGRILFAIPYETDFTLIGTTDRDFDGDPAHIAATPDEIDYLCRAVSRYLRTPVTPDRVVWTYSGVRSLYDDGATAAQEATRDYVLELDTPAGAAPLLSVFGGKITTYRRLAESALERLGPLLPAAAGAPPGWTGRTALPGGGFAPDGFAALVAETARRFPFVPAATLRRLVRAYGTDAATVLGTARSPGELGRDFGAGLTAAELRWLHDREWARRAEDVVWRRSKLGLRLDPAQIAAIDDALRAMDAVAPAAA